MNQHVDGSGTIVPTQPAKQFQNESFAPLSSDLTSGSLSRTERRKSSRAKPDWIVYVQLAAGNGGIVLDVSETGAALQMAGPLERGSICFHFQVPMAAKADISAETVWLDETRRRCGIRFTDLPEKALEEIRRWMGHSGSPQSTPREKIVPRRFLVAMPVDGAMQYQPLPERASSTATVDSQSSASSPLVPPRKFVINGVEQPAAPVAPPVGLSVDPPRKFVLNGLEQPSASLPSKSSAAAPAETPRKFVVNGVEQTAGASESSGTPPTERKFVLNGVEQPAVASSAKPPVEAPRKFVVNGIEQPAAAAPSKPASAPPKKFVTSAGQPTLQSAPKPARPTQNQWIIVEPASSVDAAEKIGPLRYTTAASSSAPRGGVEWVVRPTDVEPSILPKNSPPKESTKMKSAWPTPAPAGFTSARKWLAGAVVVALLLLLFRVPLSHFISGFISGHTRGGPATTAPASTKTSQPEQTAGTLATDREQALGSAESDQADSSDTSRVRYTGAVNLTVSNAQPAILAAPLLPNPATHGSAGVAGQAELDLALQYLHDSDSRGAKAAAADLLWKAVKKGNADAELELADLYGRGDGVERDCQQARSLLDAVRQKNDPYLIGKETAEIDFIHCN